LAHEGQGPSGQVFEREITDGAPVRHQLVTAWNYSVVEDALNAVGRHC
jgi:hypothetical protein